MSILDEASCPPIGISLVAWHPVERLHLAIDAIEPALRSPAEAGIPLVPVLRLLGAACEVATAPVAEAPRLFGTLAAWLHAQQAGETLWGMQVSAAGPRLADPVQVWLQLAAYPNLSRIMLKRLVRLCRLALAASRQEAV